MNDRSPARESSVYSNESSKYKHANKSRSASRSYSRKSRNRSRSPAHKEDRSFVIKNGCCRECMRAFSKSGKSCLCQVPKHERKYVLSEKGCNYCGCKGCNPVDVRKEKRKELKSKLHYDKSIMFKKQRLIDSDDEEALAHSKEADEFNRLKGEFESFLSTLISDVNFCGYGAPKRTLNYILGYNPSLEKEEKKQTSDKGNRQPSRDRKYSGNYNNNKHKAEDKKYSPQLSPQYQYDRK